MFVETQERPAGEPAKVGTLKLSEAMRIGAAKRPQGFGLVFSQGKTCALGAAIEGYGYDISTIPLDQWWSLPEVAPWEKNRELCESIVDRNDFGKMTREKIADWLESKGL